MNNIKPLFVRQKDLVPEQVRDENVPTCFEVCRAISRVTQDIDGAQLVRGLWKVYMNTIESRAQLLTMGFSFRGRSIEVHSDNPYFRTYSDSSSIEKVTVQDLPLNVENKDIEALIKSFPGVKLVSNIRYGTAKDPDGRWTDFKTGDRYCYIQAPVITPLPKTSRVGNIPCRIYHRSQRMQQRRCRVCGTDDHKERTAECPNYYPDQDCVIPFRFPMVFSNLYPCHMQYDGQYFRSLEHAYQYTKAKTSGNMEVAERVKSAKSGKDAKKAGDEIAEDEAWDLVKKNVMTSLVNEKVRSCEEFRTSLIASKGYTLAEATSDSYWACGLFPDTASATPPDKFPGQNMMGKILMDEREILLSLISLELDDQTNEDDMADAQTKTDLTKVGNTGDSTENCTSYTPADDSLVSGLQSQTHFSKTLSKVKSGLRRCASTGAICSSKDTVNKEDIKKYFTQPQKRRQPSVSPTSTQAKEKQIKI